MEGVKFFIPLSWHWLVMWFWVIEYFLERLVISNKVLIQSLKGGHFAHSKQLFICFSPLKFSQPICWILCYLYFSGGTSKIVTPELGVHLVVAKQNLYSEDKRKEQFVLLEERTTHVVVQTQSEVVVKVFDSCFRVIRFGAIIN